MVLKPRRAASGIHQPAVISSASPPSRASNRTVRPRPRVRASSSGTAASVSPAMTAVKKWADTVTASSSGVRARIRPSSASRKPEATASSIRGKP